MSFEDHGSHDHGNAFGAITRRRALQLGATTVVQRGFAVNGAGELAGVANGNPENLDSFRRLHRCTWHGKAQTILRPVKHSGHVTLAAGAAGLRLARLALPVVASGSGGGQNTSRLEVLRSPRGPPHRSDPAR